MLVFVRKYVWRRHQYLLLLVDILRLGVQRGVVDVLIVDTVFLATSNACRVLNHHSTLQHEQCLLTNFHLKEELHGGATLEVFGGGVEVPLDGLLGQINH
jgi:hypothetical protein